MRRPTLADVGAVAGVSAKTVSNVLHDRPEVSEATRRTVLAAVEATGYRVNQAGRGLASGRTGRVAVVVPNLYQPYFAELAERLIHALDERGYQTRLRVARDEAGERDATVGPGTHDVDGVIVCPHHFTPEMIDANPLTRPVVQLGGAPNPRVDTVVMGEREGAEAMTRHLLDQGRRRIALVWSGWHADLPRSDRYAGYVAALTSRGLKADGRLYVSGSDWDRRESGQEAMTALLRSGVAFDAALCVNDAVAVGAMRALRSHGLRVPQDVAIAGFDDTDEAGFTVPGLSSVSPEQSSMVASAVSMVLDRVEGHVGPPREVRTGAHLVLRGSTAAR